MKKLILIVVILFFGCEKTYKDLTHDPSPIPDKKILINNEYTIKVFTIDSCEYIGALGYGNYSYLSHKGNCKFCKERNKK